MILVRSNKTHTRFILREIEIQNLLLRPFYILVQYFRDLLNYHRLSVENKNTRCYDNSGSGKSKKFNGISGYGRLLHRKSGSNTPPGGPLKAATGENQSPETGIAV